MDVFRLGIIFALLSGLYPTNFFGGKSNHNCEAFVCICFIQHNQCGLSFFFNESIY